jgi:phosphoribosylamine--glycine ligase
MAKIVVVGQGAREHALGRGLSSHELVFAGGNAGTQALGRNEPVAMDDVSGIVALAKAERADLVVVGPEAPLVLGLADALRSAKIRCFGPGQEAARLEGSKVFMKTCLAEWGVPTAAFATFTDAHAAKAYVQAQGRPLVVKADGLCAGKGVVVAQDSAEAAQAVADMMETGAFGAAGRTVVIEDILPGDEASFHVLCDGHRGIPLAAAQDHKRIFDGDRGPNTGGMGAYAPAPVVTERIRSVVMDTVVEPTLAGMRARGTPFVGVLFVGLMIDRGEPRVLEFNVRFGDPETSVLVPTFAGDWFETLRAAADGELSSLQSQALHMTKGAAMGVVLAAEGYPGKVTMGDAITGLRGPFPEGGHLLHAGTKAGPDGAVETSGGRVMVAVGHGDSLSEAHRIAYQVANSVSFRGKQFRGDIGARALRA